MTKTSSKSRNGARHVLDIDDVADHLESILGRAAETKATYRAGDSYRVLRDKSLAMLFEQPSTRTRISFEAGMTFLGGHAINLNPDQMQIGRGEPVKDTSRALSSYVDAILARVADHGTLVELAEYATVPVINGLSDDAHPCQTLADLLTIQEKFNGFDIKAAWIGDGNNVARSFVIGCAITGIDLVVATPTPYDIGTDVLELAAEYGGAPEITNDPEKAVEGADIVYTDVWVSMSDEDERAERLPAFDGFQVNEALLEGESASVMHCLPAHRGEEITEGILEGERSLVWQQAENRMHAQNGLLVELLGSTETSRG